MVQRGHKEMNFPLLLKENQCNPFFNSTSGWTLPLRAIKTQRYDLVGKNKCSDFLISCNVQVTRNKLNMCNIEPKKIRPLLVIFRDVK